MGEIQIDSIEGVCSILSVSGDTQDVVATSMRVMRLIEKLMQISGFNGVVIFDSPLVNGLTAYLAP
jgi:hypothetical protein